MVIDLEINCMKFFFGIIDFKFRLLKFRFYKFDMILNNDRDIVFGKEEEVYFGKRKRSFKFRGEYFSFD